MDPSPAPGTGSPDLGSPDVDAKGRVRIGDHVPTGAELTNAMVHFYRGELGRSNIWRTRLDATTNWAVVTTAAALTFAFGGSAGSESHLVLLAISLLVLVFLFIEARRYRYYELWTHRVRLMETHFFANLLRPGSQRESDWEQRLVHSLCAPRFPISLLEALGRRYRRTYAILFLILAGSWLIKVSTHPDTASSLGELVQRSAVGALPGWLILGTWLLFNAGLLALGLFTVGLRETDAEVLGKTPRSALRLLARLRAVGREALEVDFGALKPTFSGGKHLAWIISNKAEAIGKTLLEDLDRGVTRIRAEGMYSGQEHSVLLCVIQGRQAEKLRALVYDCDPQAFVVIVAARDVRGEGFRPLEA